MASEALTREKPEIGGVAGFVIELLRRGRVARAEKTLKLEETLQLGGRRQLMLVSCGEQRFLVGAGVDGVQTIVAVDEVRS